MKIWLPLNKFTIIQAKEKISLSFIRSRVTYILIPNMLGCYSLFEAPDEIILDDLGGGLG